MYEGIYVGSPPLLRFMSSRLACLTGEARTAPREPPRPHVDNLAQICFTKSRQTYYRVAY